jgi:hypothetical protein
MSFQINAVQLAPLGGSKYVGDLAELEKKRVLRVLVAADLGFYYIEDGITKGIIADLLQHFEQDLYLRIFQKYSLTIINNRPLIKSPI